MSNRTIIITTLSVLLGGCAASHSDDVFVKGALHEREAAYIRLAKAITRYCSVSTDTLESRHTCILEQRLSLLQNEKMELALKTPAYFNTSDKPQPSRSLTP